jgi:hypothetical protein
MHEFLKLEGRRTATLCLSAFTAMCLMFAYGQPAAADRSLEKVALKKCFTKPQKMLIRAARVFDGVDLHTDAAVLISGDKVETVGLADEISGEGAREIDLGDATILPGFIELHGHVAFQEVPHDTILEHGITTLRDVGGPLPEGLAGGAPLGGDGHLRFLATGPIITVPGGYPTPVFDGHGGHGGHSDIAAPVSTPEEARHVVHHLVEGGAAMIKIGLEPGGEAGAPWTTGHEPSTPPPWPMPSLDIVKAVVDEAHSLDKRVVAHVAEPEGVKLALDAGVDEWAHVPCLEISEELLKQAVDQGVKIVTTIDTLSHCPGIHANTHKLAHLGAEFLYGAEIAHTDIPRGIDAQELHLMLHLTGMSPLDLFRTATSKAGEHLGLAPLGTLTPGAPADVIAVRGNPFEKFKPLEYPDLVISGGRVVVNKFWLFA